MASRASGSAGSYVYGGSVGTCGCGRIGLRHDQPASRRSLWRTAIPDFGRSIQQKGVAPGVAAPRGSSDRVLAAMKRFLPDSSAVAVRFSSQVIELWEGTPNPVGP